MTWCVIYFHDLPNNVIHSGRLLRGTVEITVDRPTSIGRASIRISGKTVYEKRRGRRTTTQTRTIFDSEVGLAAFANNDDVKLPAGSHNYPFEFPLPSDAPSTIRADYGYRVYKVRVYFGSLIKQEKACKELIVVKPLDLSAAPNLCMPLTGELRTPLSMSYLPFIRSSGYVEIRAQAPSRGCLPYQTVNLDIFISNQSEKRISRCLVQLVKHVRCYLQGITNWASISDYNHNVLAEATHQGCDRMSEANLGVDVIIPVTQPTDHTSEMITISYSIEITAVVDAMMYKDLVLDLPITIGSLPS